MCDVLPLKNQVFQDHKRRKTALDLKYYLYASGILLWCNCIDSNYHCSEISSRSVKKQMYEYIEMMKIHRALRCGAFILMEYMYQHLSYEAYFCAMINTVYL